jgi:hypothetical protein
MLVVAACVPSTPAAQGAGDAQRQQPDGGAPAELAAIVAIEGAGEGVGLGSGGVALGAARAAAALAAPAHRRAVTILGHAAAASRWARLASEVLEAPVPYAAGRRRAGARLGVALQQRLLIARVGREASRRLCSACGD